MLYKNRVVNLLGTEDEIRFFVMALNNKIIFETNKGNAKNDWDNLMNKNKCILNKITSSNRNTTYEKKKNLFKGIFNYVESKLKNIIEELSTYPKEELPYLINFLINFCKILKIDISPILLALYHKLYMINDKIIDTKDENLSFINVENIGDAIYFLSIITLCSLHT